MSRPHDIPKNLARRVNTQDTRDLQDTLSLQRDDIVATKAVATCMQKHKLIKYRILLNHSERFDWLNTITRFNRRTGVRLSRFRCTLAPYKKSAKNCQLCSNTRFFFYKNNEAQICPKIKNKLRAIEARLQMQI